MSNLKRKLETDGLIDILGFKRVKKQVLPSVFMTTSSDHPVARPLTKLNMNRPRQRSRSMDLTDTESVVIDDVDEKIKDLELRVLKYETESVKVCQKSAVSMTRIKQLDAKTTALDLDIERHRVSIAASSQKLEVLSRETMEVLEDYDRMTEIEHHKEMVLKSNAEEAAEHMKNLKAAVTYMQIDGFKHDTEHFQEDMQRSQQLTLQVEEEIATEITSTREVFRIALEREASRQVSLNELAVIEAKCKAILALKS